VAQALWAARGRGADGPQQQVGGACGGL